MEYGGLTADWSGQENQVGVLVLTVLPFAEFLPRFNTILS